jgi:hypothetical protein
MRSAARRGSGPAHVRAQAHEANGIAGASDLDAVSRTSGTTSKRIWPPGSGEPNGVMPKVFKLFSKLHAAFPGERDEKYG